VSGERWKVVVVPPLLLLVIGADHHQAGVIEINIVMLHAPIGVESVKTVTWLPWR